MLAKRPRNESPERPRQAVFYLLTPLEGLFRLLFSYPYLQSVTWAIGLDGPQCGTQRRTRGTKVTAWSSRMSTTIGIGPL